jgi:PAS domain S-box-containing protein
MHRPWRTWPAINASFAILFAVLGLLGYIPGLALLGSVHPDYIPMAPSTAVCFLILGIVILKFEQIQRQGTKYAIAIVLTLLVGLFGALELLGYLLGSDLNFEDTLVPEFGTLNGVPVGRMSPATGALFFLSAIAVTARFLHPENRPSPALSQTVSIVGHLALFIAFIFTLAYLYGMPLLYGNSSTIPMALTTSLGFISLSLAVLSSEPDAFPVRLLTSNSTRSYLLRYMLPLITVSIIIGGAAVLTSSKADAVNPVYISAILTVLITVIAGFLATITARHMGSRIDTSQTEAKVANRALRKSEAQLRSVIATLPDLVWLKDRNGVYLGCNRKFERFFGATEAEIVGKTDYDFVDTELADFFRKNDIAAMEAGGPTMNEEEITFADDGHKEVLETIKTPMLDNEGNLIGVLGIGRDITERKETEDALRASEVRFRNIFSQTFQFAGIVDLDGNLLAANQTSLEFIGAKEKEVIGKPFWETKWWEHDKEQKKWLQESIQHAANGAIVQREITHVSKTGHIHYFDFSLKPVVNDNGEVLYLIPESRDITEQKHSIAALLESEQRFKDVVENLPGMAYRCYNTPKWTMQFLSDGCEGLTGYLPESLIDDNALCFAQMIHPEDRERVWNGIQSQLKANQKFQIEYRIVTAFGKEKWIWEHGVGIRNEHNEITILEGVILDNDARRQAEAALEESEARYKELFQAVTHGIQEIDNEGVIVFANNAYHEMLGYKPGELVGQSMYDHIYPTSSHPELKSYIQYLVKKQPERTPWFGQSNTKDGSIIDIQTDWNYKHDEAGNVIGFISIITDITERKKAEEALKEKENIMIAQSRHAAMGEMIGMIAHQWRQPISVISMGANNMLADIELNSIDAREFKEHVQGMVKQTEYLSKTIDDFRNFFRPDKEKETTDVYQVFLEAKAIIGKTLEHANVALEVENNNGFHVMTYSRELLQVYINLLKNAKEALTETREQDRKIRVTFNDTDEHIVTSICDNGGGIDEAILGKIFEPYFTTKDEKTGTGLGLYMSKTIIEKHLHGTLIVENRDDGACFTVQIPKSGKE